MNEEREIKTLWTSYVNIDSSSLFVHGKNRLGIWLNISAAEIFSTIKANCYFTLTGKYEHFSQHWWWCWREHDELLLFDTIGNDKIRCCQFNFESEYEYEWKAEI